MGILLFSLFALFLIADIPIAISIGLSSLLALAIATNVPLAVVAQRMYAAVDSFPMMAIPYFIVAGALMERGGISRRLINLASSLVGSLPGGLGQVTVLTSMFFAAISGSGPATTAAIGGIMIPAMERSNYNRSFATALQATAGALGPLIPPSILFITFGVATGESIGDLFLSGALPGVLVGLSLMIMVYFISKKNGYVGTGNKASIKDVLNNAKQASWALMMPVIILGGIYGGVFTPTEAAVVSAIYGLIVGFFVYRELKLSDLPKIFVQSAVTSAMVMYVIATASAFSWIMSNAQIPTQIANFIIQLAPNKYILLLFLNILLLITGCFIELNAAIVILAPLMMPIMVKMGVDPIHFGAIMVTNLCLGLVTPPLGVNLYVASGISKLRIEEVAKSLIPFLAAAIVALMLITYIPEISLYLPKVMGK
ncbi:TRAP transporter large permease subunit [Thermanaerosceptrum fracticalcis]|uniref:TRAP transporter large permease subunit n=1 Tax=Thermanaerosceptrum fracticalcis TaxID=1712410 RepID=A0A7G6E2P0_THEFR|nr:TRAP transporter large permease [Thermanaerosceptrum fracticalcis]QNB46344.1 TRAP transporter large permease subunit [Thermanaerosceptrum fracticalcis]